MQTEENLLIQPAEAAKPAKPAYEWMQYVLPMAIFMIFTSFVEPRMKDDYVWVYVTKIVLVTGALIACRRPWRDIKFDSKMLGIGIASGLGLCALWVAGEKLIPYPHPEFLGSRAEFNPFTQIADPAQRALFIGARLFGMAVVVAFMEEIFWRSFLLRYLTRPEFEALPMDKFAWGPASIVCLFFGAMHPEWLSAVIFAFAMALLLKKTKSLFACIVSHGVTNLALGIYVLNSGDWMFW